MRSVHGTRRAILEILRVHGDQTVAALAGTLHVTRSAVRNHLTVLQAARLVIPRGVRPGKRRPSALYGLTPQWESAFPQIYGEFAASLLAELHVADVSRLESVLSRVSDRWIARDEPRVAGLHGHARVKRVQEILAERGFMPALERNRDGYELREYNCPVVPLSARYVEVCDAVHRWLETLLGVSVTRVKCMRQGEQYSVYEIGDESFMKS
jgi:predicted ArsR family transcriptional regulator